MKLSKIIQGQDCNGWGGVSEEPGLNFNCVSSQTPYDTRIHSEALKNTFAHRHCVVESICSSFDYVCIKRVAINSDSSNNGESPYPFKARKHESTGLEEHPNNVTGSARTLGSPCFTELSLPAYEARQLVARHLLLTLQAVFLVFRQCAKIEHHILLCTLTSIKVKLTSPFSLRSRKARLR